MEVNQQINDFKIFLERNLSWFKKKLLEANKRDDFQRADAIADWLQVNWELIVETNICQSNEFLIAYGDGADCNPESDRVRFASKTATHFIGCTCKRDHHALYDYQSGTYLKEQTVEFDRFISFKNGIILDSEVFDHVLAKDSNGNDVIISIDHTSFIFCSLK
jgi:hypothetical protein